MYKLKHKPTGLFYSPKSDSGHLNQRGKVYSYSKLIESQVLPKSKDDFRILVKRNSFAYRNNSKLLDSYKIIHDKGYEFYIETPYIDWEIIDLNKNLNELIITYKEYIEFLRKANAPAIQLAVIHGFNFPKEDIIKGQEFRDKIDKLINK